MWPLDLSPLPINEIYFLQTENPVRTSQETHYVSITKLNQLMLFREQTLSTVRTIRNTQIHCVDRMRSFGMLKHMVRIVTTGLNAKQKQFQ
jgi:hypothetical protein